MSKKPDSKEKDDKRKMDDVLRRMLKTPPKKEKDKPKEKN